MKKVLNLLFKNSVDKSARRYENDRTEGYPQYLEEATKLNLDINDYLDNHLGWLKPMPVLDEVVFPYLEKNNSSKIMEIGPGTGRWTRHILTKIKFEEYTMVDRSQWMIDFLDSYFKNIKNIRIIKNNGMSLSFENNYFDFIFSQGVFIEMKPSFIYNYAKEFSKVIKPGGYCIFDYFDFESNDGWKYFIEESDKGNIYYTYYTDEVIDKIFALAGFAAEKRFVYGKAKFVVMKKN